MKKRLAMLLFAVLFLLFSLCSCSRCSRIAERPNAQTYTKWESEDGTFVLYIDGDRQSFGTIFNNGEQFDIVVRWLDGVNLSISPVEVYDGENFVLYWDSVEPPPDEAKNEIWSYKYSPSPNKNNKIILKPTETTKFGTEQKIVLWRIEENLLPEEIEYPSIKLPNYYYLYENYKDLLDWKIKSQKEIVEKYGAFDIHNDEYYYYIVESDEEGNPKYLIQINTNSRGDLITAYLITAEKLK
jgi:lipoprotein